MVGGAYPIDRYKEFGRRASGLVTFDADPGYFIVSLLLDIGREGVNDGDFVAFQVKDDATLGSFVRKEFLRRELPRRRFREEDAAYLRFYLEHYLIPDSTRLSSLMGKSDDLLFLVARLEKPENKSIGAADLNSTGLLIEDSCPVDMRRPAVVEEEEEEDDEAPVLPHSPEEVESQDIMDTTVEPRSTPFEEHTQFFTQKSDSTAYDTTVEETCETTVEDSSAKTVKEELDAEALDESFATGGTALAMTPKGSFEFRKVSNAGPSPLTALVEDCTRVSSNRPSSPPANGISMANFETSSPLLSPPSSREPEPRKATPRSPLTIRTPDDSNRRKRKTIDLNKPPELLFPAIQKWVSDGTDFSEVPISTKPRHSLLGHRSSDHRVSSKTSRASRASSRAVASVPSAGITKRKSRPQPPKPSAHEEGMFGDVADAVFSADEKEPKQEDESDHDTLFREPQGAGASRQKTTVGSEASLGPPIPDLPVPFPTDPISPPPPSIQPPSDLLGRLEAHLQLPISNNNLPPTPSPENIPLPPPSMVESFESGLVQAKKLEEEEERLNRQREENERLLKIKKEKLVKEKADELQRVRLDLFGVGDDTIATELDDSVILPDTQHGARRSERGDTEEVSVVKETPQPSEREESMVFHDADEVLEPFEAEDSQMDHFADETMDSLPEIQHTSRHYSQAPEKTHLQQSIMSSSIESLQALRSVANKRLETLITKLSRYSRSGHYYDEIQPIIKQAKGLCRQWIPTVKIGIIGDTGDGKSSLVNALLDEDQIVATSGMMACTTVVTEISYNHETSDPYRGKVVFIEADDWVRELQHLLVVVEYRHANNKLHEDKLPEEAKAVWEKVKAVYPKINQLSQLLNYDLETLVQDPTVKRLYSEVQTYTADNTTDFEALLKPYMVSHQHTDDSDSDRKLQFWPLIKKIHVYIRAPLLKYGVTLIDLPGTHDANAGRAAIAEKHMKECTHFFIIADIKRAMDNSTAKQLISELFTNKGETATNDMVENVSFVCTSSDNIDKSETYSALAVFRKEMEAVEDHLEALKRQHVEAIKAEKRYKEEVILVDTQLRKAGKRLSVWMRRKNQARKKNWQWPVYFMKKLNSAIRNSSRKRKRADSEETPTKRQKQEDFGYEVPDSDAEDDDDEDEDESEESDDDDDDDDVEFSDDTVPAPTLAKNPDELQEIIKQFRAIKETLRKQKTAAKRAQAAESDRIPILAQEVADLEVSISERCVAARNAFVRKKIKQQYAYIIEEADEELKENAGPNSSNFELSRNYRAIEEQFRVFCVSSHGYQKLQGRLGGKDGKFQNLEATEIPALQRHVHDLAKQPHRVAAVDFSAQFSKFLNSFNIWRTSEEDRGAEGTLSEKYRAAKTVETALDAMKKAHKLPTESLDCALTALFKAHITNDFPFGISKCKTACCTIVNRLCLGPNGRTRRIPWNAFKFTCAHSGTRPMPRGFSKQKKQGAVGAIDMNADLVAPLTSTIAIAWQRVFGTDIPALLDDCQNQLVTVIREHCKTIQDNVMVFGLNQRQQALLAEIGPNHEVQIWAHVEEQKLYVKQKQVEIMRTFSEKVKEKMLPGYQAAAACVGTGMYDRMIHTVNTHIEATKETMFQEAAEAVSAEFKAFAKTIVRSFEKVAEEVHRELLRDLTTYKVLPVANLDHGTHTRRQVSGTSKRYTPRVKIDAGKIMKGAPEEMADALRGDEDVDLVQAQLLAEEGMDVGVEPMSEAASDLTEVEESQFIR